MVVVEFVVTQSAECSIGTELFLPTFWVRTLIQEMVLQELGSSCEESLAEGALGIALGFVILSMSITLIL